MSRRFTESGGVPKTAPPMHWGQIGTPNLPVCGPKFFGLKGKKKRQYKCARKGVTDDKSLPSPPPERGTESVVWVGGNQENEARATFREPNWNRRGPKR